MTACLGRLGDPTGLHCTRDAADHQPGHGCTYQATWAPDTPRDEEAPR
jgi:hypothetical protein